MTSSTDSAGTREFRGHEILSQTHAFENGLFRCTVFLFDPTRSELKLRVFKAYGPQPEPAEEAAIGEALQFLMLPDTDPAIAGTSHTALSIAGRNVEIYCDLVGEGRFQAFPFLIGVDGSRSIIMQFHLVEAITGETPGSAMNRCIRRLEEHFTAATPTES